MIKRDTDIQPVAPLEFPNPAQFPLLIPTRVFPFYCSVPMGIMGVAWHVPSCVNGQWAAALGAIEGDEPSLTTAVAVQMKVSLINNTESGVIFLLVENAISKIITESRLYELIERKRRFCDLSQLGIMSWKRITLRTRNTSLRTEKKITWNDIHANSTAADSITLFKGLGKVRTQCGIDRSVRLEERKSNIKRHSA